MLANIKNNEIVQYKFNAEEVGRLAVELGACVLVQKTYGKQGGDDMAALTKIFMSDLKEFEPGAIIKAVTQCRQTQDDFVTVAAVRRMLNPEPEMNYAVYSNLSERLRRGDQLQFQELEYIRLYEKNIISNK